MRLQHCAKDIPVKEKGQIAGTNPGTIRLDEAKGRVGCLIRTRMGWVGVVRQAGAA